MFIQVLSAVSNINSDYYYKNPFNSHNDNTHLIIFTNVLTTSYEDAKGLTTSTDLNYPSKKSEDGKSIYWYTADYYSSKATPYT